MALAEAIQVTNTLARNKLDPFNRVDVIYCKNVSNLLCWKLFELMFSLGTFSESHCFKI